MLHKKLFFREKRFIVLLVGCLGSLVISAQTKVSSTDVFPAKPEMYKKGWIDFNKNGVKDVYEDPKQDVQKRIDNLLSQMNLDEKTCQVATFYGYRKALRDSVPTEKWLTMVLKDGIANIDEHLNKEITDHNLLAKSLAETQRFFVEYTRLGIPVDFSNEGIRGLCAAGATSFPSMNALGCTWDKELAYLQGLVQGKEARSMGYTNVYAPILDVTRDQRWGRWEGSIAEDPYLVARIGVAMAKGLQDQRVVSTPKHYLAYGDCKAARQWESRTDPHVTPSEMYYIHEYPFRKVFQEAGALGVMCAYNDYDGVPIAGSYHYLTEVLRGEMNFKGYVVSDSHAIGRQNSHHRTTHNFKESGLSAMRAGLNVRTDFNDPSTYINNIRELVKEGALSEKRLDEMVRDVLYVKFWLGLFDNPYTGDPKEANKIVASQEHLDIALRASRECLALLKNKDDMLPLRTKYKKIAVVGPNAHTNTYVNTHYGPSKYGAFVSVYDGLKAVYEDTDVEVNYAKGIDLLCEGWPECELIPTPLDEKEKKDIAEAVQLANNSDVVVLAVGDDWITSGESRTRSSLDLPGHQEELVKAMVATGKPVILVLIWGRPATINYADKYCPAILSASYPGAQGGRAIAEALKGDYNPGGKLNGTWVKTVGQLPYNVPTKPNANWEPVGYKGTAGNKGLLYCFGHGLSYTTFKYDDLKIDSVFTQTAHVEVACRVTNTGKVAGDEVVQLYLNDVISSTTTYEKVLRGFERIHLKPGESKEVKFTIVPDDLILINTEKQRVVEPGEFKVMIGSSYDDIRLNDSFFYKSTVEQARNGYKEEKNVKMMNDDNYKVN